MQVQCPQCAQKLTVEDARVPDRPFSLKCPRCQNVIRLPGRGPAAPPVPEPPVPDQPATAPEAAPGGAPSAVALVNGGARALIALPSPNVAAAATALLTRLGFSVDTLDDVEQGARPLEQGLYTFVATMRATGGPGQPETLYQRLGRLSSEARRRVFVAVVGEEFKTGDGMQAFAVLADAVLHPRDVASADRVLRSAIEERTRLYQTFLDARARYEASAS